MSQPQDDWAAQTARTIESAVDAVKSRTTVPLTTAARGLVYGTLVLVLTVVAIVLLAIASVRALDSYVPGDVWVAHLITGAIFSVLGLFLWAKRRRPKEE